MNQNSLFPERKAHPDKVGYFPKIAMSCSRQGFKKEIPIFIAVFSSTEPALKHCPILFCFFLNHSKISGFQITSDVWLSRLEKGFPYLPFHVSKGPVWLLLDRRAVEA